jgi:hypothetical protein
MLDYASYPSNMPHDFELYANTQEQQLEYPLTSQPFLPTSSYAMDQAFSASYDPMVPLADAPRPHDLQFHYDAIAQGVKPFEYNTPAGSPHSTHSFHEQPPVLSASSESGASVSSSAMGSPSHFNEPWNPVGLGFTSGFEYPGMVSAEKSFVGESMVSFATVSSTSSVASPTSPLHERNVFKTPVTPASASWSAARPRGRRNSLLSHEVRPCDVIPTTRFLPVNAALPNSHSLELSCWFPSVA